MIIVQCQTSVIGQATGMQVTVVTEFTHQWEV